MDLLLEIQAFEDAQKQEHESKDGIDVSVKPKMKIWGNKYDIEHIDYAKGKFDNYDATLG